MVCGAERRLGTHLDIDLLARNVERVRHAVLLALAGRRRPRKLDAARVIEMESKSGERMLDDEHADQAGVPDADRSLGRDEETSEGAVAVALQGGSTRSVLRVERPGMRSETHLHSGCARYSGACEGPTLEQGWGDDSSGERGGRRQLDGQSTLAG